MKIVVLCGGISAEREISLRTSMKVADALQKKGHDVNMIDVYFGTERIPDFTQKKDFKKEADYLRSQSHLIKSSHIDAPLFGPNVLDACRAADIVFIGLHGENGEDGKVQAAFDKENIKYTGSGAESSAIAMSKAEAKKIASPHIRMPKGVVLKKGEKQTEIKAPCVIKPDNGGSSIGVIIVSDDSEYEEALMRDFEFCDTVLVEEYIKGRELTQAVLDNKALPPVEICPDTDAWYDYENKYSGNTKEVCPADIPDEVLREMSEVTLKFGELIGLSVYYRIDYLLDDEGRLYALEANSLPGMTDTSLIPQEAQAIGIDYPDLCEMIIEKSLEKYNK